MKYTCPCCGYKTLSQSYRGSYEICPICYWEDDGVQYGDPDHEGGANPMSLRQAQKNFQRLGACEEEMLPFVRRPAPDEEKDTSWRMLLFWIFLMIATGHAGFAQVHDSSFWAEHSLSRPDSVLVMDTLLFPNNTAYASYTYTDSGKRSRWADSGSVLYESGEDSKSVSITLRGDHTFILSSRGKPIEPAGSIGRWWQVGDSLVCLNWFGVLTLEISRHAHLDYIHKKIAPLTYISTPIRVDHWWFVRRGNQLVPYR
ncbi:MAG: hypothetical protein J0H07_02300 [Sphingobacteriales bacterium]|nr:hypothetical protein [Sphingobacteriales bacterium]